MKDSTRKFLKRFIPILFTILGGIGGFAYYYFVGCPTGTCPIAASPILMPFYGAGIGLMIGILLQPSEKKQEHRSED